MVRLHYRNDSLLRLLRRWLPSSALAIVPVFGCPVVPGDDTGGSDGGQTSQGNSGGWSETEGGPETVTDGASISGAGDDAGEADSGPATATFGTFGTFGEGSDGGGPGTASFGTYGDDFGESADEAGSGPDSTTGAGSFSTSADPSETFGDDGDPPGEPQACEGDPMPIAELGAAVAVPESDLYPSGGDDGEDTGVLSSSASDTVGADTGFDGDPDTLILFLSDEVISCEEPRADLGACTDHWSMRLRIPPELRMPGVYDLFYDLNGTLSMTTTDGEGCGGGGGSATGTLEILEVTDTTLVGRLCHVGIVSEANGTFVAEICS